jgi:membrane protease YdiL (CAAX protease family)
MGQPHQPTTWRRLRQWFVEPLRRADVEARAYVASNAGRRVDGKVIAILITTAVTLTVQRFVGQDNGYYRAARLLEWLGFEQFAAAFAARLSAAGEGSLERLTWWAAVCVATYVMAPALLIRFGLRARLWDYGVKPYGALAGWPIYVAMFVIMVPLVAWMSSNEHFQATYPFYNLARNQPLWPWFWCWEALYAIQFVALEFFFRGFLLHGIRQRFGAYSILVMMIPYCMIHFSKPMPEAFAAIIAGLALGYMSLRTRSIWLGAAIHITVALSMDFASLWRQGWFA